MNTRKMLIAVEESGLLEAGTRPNLLVNDRVLHLNFKLQDKWCNIVLPDAVLEEQSNEAVLHILSTAIKEINSRKLS